MTIENNPDKIIVHHTADSSPGPQFDKVNAAHEGRGFIQSSLGYFVGYHFLIEKDGTTRMARLITEAGCHCIGENYNSVGVCLAGDFDVELPTKAQEDALGTLLDWICGAYSISPRLIFPHRNFSMTDCYGKNLTPSWAVEILTAYRGGQKADLQPCTSTQ